MGEPTSTFGTYSNKYRALEHHHLELLKQEVLGTFEDIASKNKKLSAETNKRRRDLNNKKKQRENEEERRRLEILAERKARMIEATQKYQRSHVIKNHSRNERRGFNRRAHSAPVTPTRTPVSMEEVLRNIRGGTNNTPQYNTGDSGSTFLQKYGSYKVPDSFSRNQHDATDVHQKSVKNLDTSNSLFEQQLMQHQADQIAGYDIGFGDAEATLIRHQAIEMQKVNDRFIRELSSDNVHNGNTTDSSKQSDSAQDVDAASVASADSLDGSEQPSACSHAINNTGKPVNRVAANNMKNIDYSTGGDTYRQESSSVRPPDDDGDWAQHVTGIKFTAHQQLSIQNNPSNFGNAKDFRKQPQSTSTTRYPSETNFTGFQVVNNSKSNSWECQSSLPANQVSVAAEQEQTSTTMTNSGASPTTEYYVKSRKNSHSKFVNGHVTAWEVPSSTDFDRSSGVTESNSKISDLNCGSNNSTGLKEANSISDLSLVSDSGPKSILKRTPHPPGMHKSRSAPNIRDSLEMAKAHYKLAGRESPKSEKKSVRFMDSNSEPQLIQAPKNQSPSKANCRVVSTVYGYDIEEIKKGIPVPTKPALVTSAITHNSNRKPPPGRQKSSINKKGPVVAKHDAHIANKESEMNVTTPSSDSNSARSINDLPLNRTPTDDEINWLWDKVRDCLQSPASSARSAPEPEVSQPRQPQKPIVKITTQNIHSLGRATSAPPRVRQRRGSDSSIQSNEPLLNQRAKQEQKTFVTQPVHRLPAHSAMEPHLSHMVNNDPNNASESMMAFLTAETMADNPDVSESRILHAMNDAQYRQQLDNNGRPSAPVSALSMEEQRLLQSLDRLNERLNVVEINGYETSNQHVRHLENNVGSDAVSVQEYKPTPPPFDQQSTSARGFRGHRPLMSKPKGLPDNVRYKMVTSPGRQYRMY